MTWTKLDDSFLGDPKFRKPGPHAELAYIRGLIYCNRYLTDGVIATDAVRDLCQGFEREAGRIASALVSAGLWTKQRDGFKVRNYLDNQKSKRKVMADRKANAERQRRFQQRLRDLDEAAARTALANAVSNGTPTRPDPSRTRDLSKRRTGGAGGPLQPAIEHLAAKMRMPS